VSYLNLRNKNEEEMFFEIFHFDFWKIEVFIIKKYLSEGITIVK
jgi:hypothetical protein